MWFHLCRLNKSIEANDIQIGVLNIDHVGCDRRTYSTNLLYTWPPANYCITNINLGNHTYTGQHNAVFTRHSTSVSFQFPVVLVHQHRVIQTVMDMQLHVMQFTV